MVISKAKELVMFLGNIIWGIEDGNWKNKYLSSSQHAAQKYFLCTYYALKNALSQRFEGGQEAAAEGTGKQSKRIQEGKGETSTHVHGVYEVSRKIIPFPWQPGIVTEDCPWGDVTQKSII